MSTVTKTQKRTDTCPDCGVIPGRKHSRGCDVERCPDCGGQMLSCGCDPVYHRSIPWDGTWPGHKECEERGWYAHLVPGIGWQSCAANAPGAHPDLNRLSIETRWNPKTRKREDVK